MFSECLFATTVSLVNYILSILLLVDFRYLLDSRLKFTGQLCDLRATMLTYLEALLYSLFV